MTEPAQHSSAKPVPMEPTRNPEVTLSDLITVLLDKGTYLNIDLIISVADIPLIGVNLRAMIAGMETMLEYGMMRDWDEKTRAWVRKSVARHFPLRDNEEIIAKMAGGHFQQDFAKTWRPGGLYLTNQRLVIFRRDPKEILWETELAQITALRLYDERTIGSEVRTRLLVDTSDGLTTMLSASAPQRIRELITQQRPVVQLPSDVIPKASDSSRLPTSHAWYQEIRAGGSLWRGGKITADEERLIWQAPADARPAVYLKWEEITAVELLDIKAPSGYNGVIRLSTAEGPVHLAAAYTQQWLNFLTKQLGQDAESKEEFHAGN